MRIDGETKIEVSIDGQAVEAYRVSGSLRLSRLFWIEIEALDDADETADPRELLGRPVQIELQPIVGPALVIRGVLFGVQSEAAPGGLVSYRRLYEVGGEVAALTLGCNQRYFQDLDVVAIVKQVLDPAVVDPAMLGWEVNGTYRKRPYTAQIGESDWDFIDRLLAEEGIGYRFDFEDERTKLVFFDDALGAPEVEGGSIAARRESELEASDDAVYTLALRQSVVEDALELREYNPDTPALDLKVEAKTDTSRYPVYDYPGRYGSAAEGKQLAARRLEALRAGQTVVSGRSTGLRLWPGRSVALKEGLLDDDFPQRLFVVRLDLHVERGHEAGKHRVDILWEAVPSDVPWRPSPRLPPERHVQGVQTGRVVGPSGSELYTDDGGNVRAQFWWDREGTGDEQASTFMRVGQFPVGNSMTRPRIGWEVLLDFREGDADFPFVLSHLYDGTHPPPYALPANKTRTAWQTATTPGGGSANEIRFEDAAGSEEMFLNASKDMSVAIGDAHSETTGNNHNHTIGSNLNVEVGANCTTGVTSAQRVKIGASETLTVGAGRTTGIKGSENVTIGASRTVIALTGRSLQASSGRTMTVGANLLAVSALGVNRAVLGSANVTVGGTWITVAGAGLGNATLGAGAEVVGGVKLQLGSGIALNVKGALAEAVGAAYVNVAGKNCGETATGSLSVKVGGAFLANSPSIEMEAKNEIKIVCGASSITMTSSSIEVKSPAIPVPAGQITKVAGHVYHNA